MQYLYKKIRITTCLFILITWAVAQVESAPSPASESQNTESSESEEKTGGKNISEDEKEESKEVEPVNNDDNDKPESKSASGEQYNDDSSPVRSTKALDTKDFEPKEDTKPDSISEIDDNRSKSS